MWNTVCDDETRNLQNRITSHMHPETPQLSRNVHLTCRQTALYYYPAALTFSAMCIFWTVCALQRVWGVCLLYCRTRGKRVAEPTGLRHVHAALAGSAELSTWPENPFPAAPGCSRCSGGRAHTAWIWGTLPHHPDMTHTHEHWKVRPHTKVSRAGAAV